MFFTQAPQFPTFYSWNDIQRKAEEATLKTIDFNKVLVDHTIAYFDSVTDNTFTTYTKKVVNLNKNIAEDAKKIIKSEIKETKA
jgi:hypothetical protein